MNNIENLSNYVHPKFLRIWSMVTDLWGVCIVLHTIIITIIIHLIFGLQEGLASFWMYSGVTCTSIFSIILLYQ